MNNNVNLENLKRVNIENENLVTLQTDRSITYFNAPEVKSLINFEVCAINYRVIG